MIEMLLSVVMEPIKVHQNASLFLMSISKAFLNSSRYTSTSGQHVINDFGVAMYMDMYPMCVYMFKVYFGVAMYMYHIMYV